MLKRPSFLLLSTISIPAVTVLVAAYLHNHPLSASRTRQITKERSVCASFAASNTVRKSVNPRHHNAMFDSYTINLSPKEVSGLSDEMILARFLTGYFGGWIFYTERNLIYYLGKMGITMGTHFKDVPDDGVLISTFPLGLKRDQLPPKHSRLFNGNFLILDLELKPKSASFASGEQQEGSYVDVAFGNVDKTFAGVHRFEVVHKPEQEGDKASGVTIRSSHISCNPAVASATFPKFFFDLHIFYAVTLFRDGVAELLKN